MANRNQKKYDAGTASEEKYMTVSILQSKITKKVQFATTTEDQIATGKKMNSRKIAAGVLRKLRPWLTGMKVKMNSSISLIE